MIFDPSEFSKRMNLQEISLPLVLFLWLLLQPVLNTFIHLQNPHHSLSLQNIWKTLEKLSQKLDLEFDFWRIIEHLFVEREIDGRIIGGWIGDVFWIFSPIQSVHEIHQSRSFGGQDGDDSEENTREEDETNGREHLLREARSVASMRWRFLVKESRREEDSWRRGWLFMSVIQGPRNPTNNR